MDEDDGSAGCTAIDDCAIETHDCVSFYGAVENGVNPGVQLVSGPRKVECVLTLTNAILMTENVMLMLIASMMKDAHSLVMMLSVTMLLVMTLMDHLNVLVSLATLILHALTTTNTKMVLIIVTKMHHVPTLTEASHALVIQASKVKMMSVPISMSALLNMLIKTSTDQTLIPRIPLQDIFVVAQTASLVSQPMKKTTVKIVTNATLTVTITATTGPYAPTKSNFTACTWNKPCYYCNGVECFDIDECDDAFGGNDCSNGANSVCNNIDGSYYCTCGDGYYSTNDANSVCADRQMC